MHKSKHPYYVVQHLKEKEIKSIDDIVFEMREQIIGNLLASIYNLCTVSVSICLEKG